MTVQWPLVEHFGFVMRWDTWAMIVTLAQILVPFVGILVMWLASRYYKY